MEDQLRRMLKEKESLLQGSPSSGEEQPASHFQSVQPSVGLHQGSGGEFSCFRECQVRITSIALLHETLHRSHDLSPYQNGRLHSHLDRTPVSLVRRRSHADYVDLAVDDVEFDIDTGLTCGLIIDELVSNCLKHAFVDHGWTVRISPCWTMSTARLRSRVSDDGIGIPKDGVLNNPDSLGSNSSACLRRSWMGIRN